jgi:hypothetical protein
VQKFQLQNAEARTMQGERLSDKIFIILLLPQNSNLFKTLSTSHLAVIIILLLQQLIKCNQIA